MIFVPIMSLCEPQLQKVYSSTHQNHQVYVTYTTNRTGLGSLKVMHNGVLRYLHYFLHVIPYAWIKNFNCFIPEFLNWHSCVCYHESTQRANLDNLCFSVSGEPCRETCWTLLYSLCPAFAVVSSLLSSLLIYYCQKTGKSSIVSHLICLPNYFSLFISVIILPS